MSKVRSRLNLLSAITAMYWNPIVDLESLILLERYSARFRLDSGQCWAAAIQGK